MDRTRRLRASEALRSMVRENHVRVEELIYPLFIMEGTDICNPVASMPGICQYSLDRLPEGEFELLINATPVGMYPHPGKSPVPAEYLAGVRTVFDAVYNPADTRLLQDARKMGCRVQGGMAMLVWQAAAAHSIWDGSVYTPEQIQQVTEEMNALMEIRFQQSQAEKGEN